MAVVNGWMGLKVRCECPHCRHVWDEEVEEGDVADRPGQSVYVPVWCPVCGRMGTMVYALYVVGIVLRAVHG